MGHMKKMAQSHQTYYPIVGLIQPILGTRQEGVTEYSQPFHHHNGYYHIPEYVNIDMRELIVHLETDPSLRELISRFPARDLVAVFLSTSMEETGNPNGYDQYISDIIVETEVRLDRMMDRLDPFELQLVYESLMLSIDQYISRRFPLFGSVQSYVFHRWIDRYVVCLKKPRFCDAGMADSEIERTRPEMEGEWENEYCQG